MIGVLAHGLGEASVLPVPLPAVLVVVGGAVLACAARLTRPATRPAEVTGAAPRGSEAAAVGGVTTRTRPVIAAVAAAPGRGDDATASAHGVRSRSDETASAPDVRERSAPPGRTLPAWVTTAVDAAVTRTGLRAFGVLSAALVLALAAAGPVNPDANPATRLVLVVAWAGLIPLSVAAPGAWRVISPLRTLSGLLARLTGDPQEQGARPLPDGIGWWPAVAALGAFAIVEGPLRGQPTALLAFLICYGLVQLAAAAVYGSAWFAHGEAFEVLAAVVGRLSPVARGPDGRLWLSSPRVRLAAPVPPGTTALVGVLVGAAVADFIGDLPAWNRFLLGNGGPTAALEIGLLALAVGVATALTTAAARPRPLTPAVVPVATGYLFAHYFAVLLIEGQVAFAQLSALVRGGAAALSAAQISVRYELLPATLAATIQLLGFLLPHLIAVAVGIDIARSRYGAARVRTATAPLVAILTLSAVAGTAARYGAG